MTILRNSSDSYFAVIFIVSDLNEAVLDIFLSTVSELYLEVSSTSRRYQVKNLIELALYDFFSKDVLLEQLHWLRKLAVFLHNKLKKYVKQNETFLSYVCSYLKMCS